MQGDATPRDAREADQENHDAQEMAGNTSRQANQEVLDLRARRAELEDRLATARSTLASARERREFMEEETEQAREYGKKLAQEMSRLARIAQTLPPDQSSSLEKLRRLAATLSEVEQQEKGVLEDGRAQEDALRTEIDEFTGGQNVSQPPPGPDTASASQSSSASAAGRHPEVENAQGRGGAAGGRERSGRATLENSADDPLAAAAAEAPDRDRGEGDEKGGTRARGDAAGVNTVAVVARAARKKTPEGKALLAEGLHRIEAAHEEAAAEREAAASRLSRLRLAVARRQREEDATPGHAELLQYLLRFEELGQHALEREKQLRRCRTERSTVAQTREFLANESRLLETIASGAEEAGRGGKGARESYLRQLEGIVQEVEDSLANQTHRLDAARSRRRAAEDTQQSASEDRKRFLTGSKELTQECYRHEALTAHLVLMRR